MYKEIKIRYDSDMRENLFNRIIESLKRYEFENDNSKRIFKENVVKQCGKEIILEYRLMKDTIDNLIFVIVFLDFESNKLPDAGTFTITLKLKKDQYKFIEQREENNE